MKKIKSLTKTQFFDEYKARVSETLGLDLSLKQVASAIQLVFDIACDHATDYRGCTIPGFAKVSVLKTKPRMGRNPSTGESIKIPSKVKGSLRLVKPMRVRLADIGESVYGSVSKKKTC